MSDVEGMNSRGYSSRTANEQWVKRAGSGVRREACCLRSLHAVIVHQQCCAVEVRSAVS